MHYQQMHKSLFNFKTTSVGKERTNQNIQLTYLVKQIATYYCCFESHTSKMEIHRKLVDSIKWRVSAVVLIDEVRFAERLDRRSSFQFPVTVDGSLAEFG